MTLTTVVADADAMAALGHRLAGLLRPGDLVVLDGPLGAGKTTLTRGIGAGLRVRGDVSSPTFVIARRHRAVGAAPPLLHVDAYRLSAEELADLELDAEASDAVCVVEWGAGKVESWNAERLHIVIDVPAGDPDAARTVTIAARGPRWEGADLDALGSAP